MNTAQAAATTIDLWPIVETILGLVLTALGTLASLAVHKLIAKLGAEKGLIDEAKAEKLRAFALQVIQGGIGYADELARQYGRDRSTVTVRNEMVGVALSYAVQHGGERLRQLGLTNDAVARIILARMETPANPAPDPISPMRLPPSSPPQPLPPAALNAPPLFAAPMSPAPVTSLGVPQQWLTPPPPASAQT